MSTPIEGKHMETYSRLTELIAAKPHAGKTVLITGGSRGIGVSTARSFAEAGAAKVIITGRTQANLDATVEKLSREIPSTVFEAYVSDVASDDDVSRLFAGFSTSPDVLVNNAGFLSSPKNFVDADLKDWWKSFEVNIWGTLLFTQRYLQHRRDILAKTSDKPAPAVILTMNTSVAYNGWFPATSAYGGSKAGLFRAIEQISLDVPQDLARFISIHPGLVESEMSTKSGFLGHVPPTDEKLPADFLTWLATEEAAFLAGRFVWCHWDVDELIALKGEIAEKGLFRTSVRGADYS